MFGIRTVLIMIISDMRGIDNKKIAPGVFADAYGKTITRFI